MSCSSVKPLDKKEDTEQTVTNQNKTTKESRNMSMVLQKMPEF